MGSREWYLFPWATMLDYSCILRASECIVVSLNSKRPQHMLISRLAARRTMSRSRTLSGEISSWECRGVPLWRLRSSRIRMTYCQEIATPGGWVGCWQWECIVIVRYKSLKNEKPTGGQWWDCSKLGLVGKSGWLNAWYARRWIVKTGELGGKTSRRAGTFHVWIICDALCHWILASFSAQNRP